MSAVGLKKFRVAEEYVCCRICHEEVLCSEAPGLAAAVAAATTPSKLRSRAAGVLPGDPGRTRWALRLLRHVLRWVARVRVACRQLWVWVVVRGLRQCWARWTRAGNAPARETRRGAVEGQRGPCVAADDPRALIAPCRCTGTLKYVHQGCLRRWLRRQPDTALWRCEICGEPYRFQVEFRPAYEFLFAWPLGDRTRDPDEEEGDDNDDDGQNGARAAGGWAAPNEALVERGAWTTSPAAASATSSPPTTDRVRRCLAGLRRWWQALRAQSGGGTSSSDAFGNGPAAATNRLLHWLHVLYVALFLRQVLRQCRGLHTAAKRALQLDSLAIAMQQGNDAIRALMETHALIVLRAALLAHYLLFLAVDLRLLQRQYLAWRAATARFYVLNRDDSNDEPRRE